MQLAGERNVRARVLLRRLQRRSVQMHARSLAVAWITRQASACARLAISARWSLVIGLGSTESESRVATTLKPAAVNVARSRAAIASVTSFSKILSPSVAPASCPPCAGPAPQDRGPSAMRQSPVPAWGSKFCPCVCARRQNAATAAPARMATRTAANLREGFKGFSSNQILDRWRGDCSIQHSLGQINPAHRWPARSAAWDKSPSTSAASRRRRARPRATGRAAPA